MAYETLRWVGGTDGCLQLLDQRKLPHNIEYICCRSVEQVREAICTLAVRGAPAIGVAAAYGFVLALQTVSSNRRAFTLIDETADYLSMSRPTAVNLFYAVRRMRSRAAYLQEAGGITLGALRKAILNEAEAIRIADVEMCLCIARNGQKLIPEGGAILTHCNAGALATAGQGTALAPMFEAKNRGRNFCVYVDETRPLLQGARLTAWELMQAGIEVRLICDSAAGWLMKQGRISAVFTGADRIAANGDAANKIGTYSLSVLARANGVPFYVAAPTTTFDMASPDGKKIRIEERKAEEITLIAGNLIAPEGVGVCNPAFDVTDAGNITAIITEKGIIKKPDTDSIRMHLTS